MADYFEPTIVRPTIRDADMTPLERLLLSRVFQSEDDGEEWYFFAEQAPDTMITVDRASLAAALAETRADDSSVHAYVAEQLSASPADDADIDLDLSGTSWEFMLQDIVKRSATLAYVAVVSAFTCSKMRPDGFGGMAMLITADAIRGKSTAEVLGDFLDEAEHGPLGVAPGFGVHVLLRLAEKDVRAAVPTVIESAPELTALAAADISDADVRSGCLSVVEHLDLREDHGLAIFKAVLAAIDAAEARRSGP